MLEGVSSVTNFITAYEDEESQENRDSHFLIRSVFFVSKGNLFNVYSPCKRTHTPEIQLGGLWPSSIKHWPTDYTRLI